MVRLDVQGIDGSPCAQIKKGNSTLGKYFAAKRPTPLNTTHVPLS